jgi:hypothetical protein
MFEELGLNVARQPDNGANPRPDNRSGLARRRDARTPIDELIDQQRTRTSGTRRRSCATQEELGAATAGRRPNAYPR